MRINVMPATGQLGRRVVRSLLDQGVSATDVVASVRMPEKASDMAERGVAVVHADYDHPPSLRTAFEDTEVLVVIPTLAPVEPRIQQHFHALQAAKECGVKRVLFTSLSTAAYPDSKFHVTPFFLYAESKLRLSGMDWTIVRNSMYLDPVADWIPELVQMGRLPYPVTDGRVAYVTRDDLAKATASACINSGHSEKVYELTGPEALSMPALADIISRVTGQSVRFYSVTEKEYAGICREGEENVPEYLIEILISLYRAVDNGEFASVTYHVDRISGSPAESAERFLSRTLTEI